MRKKKILYISSLFIMMCAVIEAVNVFGKNANSLSSLTFANIEALSAGEATLPEVVVFSCYSTVSYAPASKVIDCKSCTEVALSKGRDLSSCVISGD